MSGAQTSATRIAALDALRGVLAALIVVHHVASASGYPVLAGAAWWIVAAFWALSGYVLTIGYDGRYASFLVRRVVRLWPVFAVCTTAGALLLGRAPTLGELTWQPASIANGALALPDPPAWSLYVEIWASPALPLMFRAARTEAGAIALLTAALILVIGNPIFAPLGCFAIGVAATRLPIDWRGRTPAPLLWLGRVSYSLYLSHFLAIVAGAAAFGRLGPALALLAIPGLAWVLWRFVERPSHALSRRIAA